MKYFTEAWASGELEEDAYAAVIPQYNDDLAAAFEMDSAVRRFAESVGLNDAYLDRLTINRATASCRLLLLTGSLQIGYWHTELIYRGVSRIEGEPSLRAALTVRPTEIWYDEFRREGDEICHAVLLAPHGSGFDSAGEFGIWFREFDCVQTPAADRALMSPDDESNWDVA